MGKKGKKCVSWRANNGGGRIMMFYYRRSVSQLVGWLRVFFSYFDIYADFPFDLRKYPHSVVFSLHAFYHESFQLLWKHAINYHQPISLIHPLSIRNQLVRQIKSDILTHLPDQSVCCMWQMGKIFILIDVNINWIPYVFRFTQRFSFEIWNFNTSNWSFKLTFERKRKVSKFLIDKNTFDYTITCKFVYDVSILIAFWMHTRTLKVLP